MAVIADNMPAILAVADRQTGLDETARRLRAFVDWQYFFCFCGLVPGSLKDEESPFNECSHAYLAGTQALLLELRQTRGDRADVRALVDKVGLDMVRNSAALVLCRFSGEAFNTADVAIAALERGARASAKPGNLRRLRLSGRRCPLARPAATAASFGAFAGRMKGFPERQ